MPDTLPNVIVEPQTVTDIYAETGITVGKKINVEMIGPGTARLYAGATLSQAPNNSTGYRNIETGENYSNDSGDAGAWVWSSAGCTLNVKEVV